MSEKGGLQAAGYRPQQASRRGRGFDVRTLAIVGLVIVFVGGFGLFAVLAKRAHAGWVSSVGAIVIAAAALLYYRSKMIDPSEEAAELRRIDDALRLDQVAVVELEADAVLTLAEPEGAWADVFRVAPEQCVWVQRGGDEALPPDGRVPAQVSVELHPAGVRHVTRSGAWLTPIATITLPDADSFVDLHLPGELTPFRATLEDLQRRGTP